MRADERVLDLDPVLAKMRWLVHDITLARSSELRFAPQLFSAAQTRARAGSGRSAPTT